MATVPNKKAKLWADWRKEPCWLLLRLPGLTRGQVPRAFRLAKIADELSSLGYRFEMEATETHRHSTRRERTDEFMKTRSTSRQQTIRPAAPTSRTARLLLPLATS